VLGQHRSTSCVVTDVEPLPDGRFWPIEDAKRDKSHRKVTNLELGSEIAGDTKDLGEKLEALVAFVRRRVSLSPAGSFPRKP
jgi:hypothetical protein